MCFTGKQKFFQQDDVSIKSYMNELCIKKKYKLQGLALTVS